MSSSSGISVSAELSSAFSEALTSQLVRFLKISIHNELLVPEQSVPPTGTLNEDLDKLGDILEDNVPAYVLVRLDDPPTEWIAVFYVPETAKVRDKMLYASSRSSLTKSLGSAPFSDSIFATTKSDVTASAYAKHRASLTAPKPMSQREKEMAEIKAAETKSATYNGSRDRVAHVAREVGYTWSDEVENAVKELNYGDASKLVILTIDPSTESMQLHSASEVTADDLGSSLPASEPSYSFFAWARPSRRDVVFIYSCPSSSSVKHRMLYSTGTTAVFRYAKKMFEQGPSTLAARRIETSDPQEINEAYLKTELLSVSEGASFSSGSGATTPVGGERAFARPKGPNRKR